MIDPEQDARIRKQMALLPSFLRRMAEKAMEGVKERLAVDPQRFDDPVALKTEWTPLKRGGSTFRTRRLRKVGHNRMDFGVSPGGMAFSLAFLASGLASLIMVPLLFLPRMEGLPPLFKILLPLSGIPFVIAGAWLLYTFRMPVAFDKALGWYWKGYRPPSLVGGSPSPREGMPLSRAHALQILSKVVRSDRNTYTCWELNLVGRDGTRLHLVQTGRYQDLRAEADHLASFLGISVWDAGG